MAGTLVTPKFETWSAAGHNLRIDYSNAVLDQIRMTAVEGYHRVPHGGVETGGVLFGTHQENAVCITAWRPIACEYAKGPSFLLSEKDIAALEEALQSWGSDAELDGLEPVGWYRAHTRSEVFLADADLAFFNSFFPRPWQVGLIVRPASFAPTRAGFFFRERDGNIRAQSSYHEFTLLPLAAPSPAAAAPETRAVPSSSPAAAVTEAPHIVSVSPAPLPPPAAIEPRLKNSYLPVAGAAADRGGSGARWKWYVAGLAAVAVAALGFWLLKPSNQGLKLSAADVGGQLRIAWDGTARSIRDARYGSIEIDDHGVRTNVNLNSADLRSGSIYYARQSGDVAVRLTVNVPGGLPVAETTLFLGPPVSAKPPPQVAATGAPEPPREPKPSPARVAPPLAPPVPQPAAPAVPARHVVRFQAPSQTPRQLSAALPAIAPPTIAPQNIGNLSAAQPAGLASVLEPKAAPAPPPRPASPAPVRSGRIIWTGRLGRNGSLVLERNHASTGAVSGALPALAARVIVYPGELTAAGITLFTADAKYSQPRTEKAGAENGWNPTTYVWDPKRAAGIRVLEQPGPQNGFRLVLVSDIAKLSVLMLEWRATQ